MKDIKSIAAYFEQVSFHHVLREANFFTDALANLGHSHSNMSCWEDVFPTVVRHALSFNLFGADCSTGFSL